ncbi:MAG: hypothetical protein AB8C13_11105 [Phycisphaerales bacterium]
MASEELNNSDALIAAVGERVEWMVPVDACSICACTPDEGGGCDERLIHELVFSMLLWESTMENAVRAMEKIREHVVDYNELRVCFPHEVEALLGSRYQRAGDRSVRLITVLGEIFEKFQKLTLEPLREMNKREARDVLMGFESLPRFVVSRVMLLGLDAHALPLDSKIARALHKAKLIESAKNPDTIAVSLERSIRANQSLETYTRIERWLIAFENGS